MNKRQRKKMRKKILFKHYKETGIDRLRCEECGKKLDVSNQYHWKYGTCNNLCYGRLVGVYC